MLDNLIKEIYSLKNPDKAILLQGFFKTWKWEYGEGDKFLGIIMPIQRKLAKKYVNISLEQVQVLLDNSIHEFRMIWLLILTYKYPKVDELGKNQIYDFYIKNLKRVNNWDLVDVTTPKIVWVHLMYKDRSILYRFVRSDNLWERRIAVLSTFEFIRNKQFEDSIKISELLMQDKHDLIHKAVGWMLREIGKRDQNVLENFLNKYAGNMPRTMLRYSIEKLDNEKRTYFMGK